MACALMAKISFKFSKTKCVLLLFDMISQLLLTCLVFTNYSFVKIKGTILARVTATAGEETVSFV